MYLTPYYGTQQDLTLTSMSSRSPFILLFSPLFVPGSRRRRLGLRPAWRSRLDCCAPGRGVPPHPPRRFYTRRMTSCSLYSLTQRALRE